MTTKSVAHHKTSKPRRVEVKMTFPEDLWTAIKEAAAAEGVTATEFVRKASQVQIALLAMCRDSR